MLFRKIITLHALFATAVVVMIATAAARVSSFAVLSPTGPRAAAARRRAASHPAAFQKKGASAVVPPASSSSSTPAVITGAAVRYPSRLPVLAEHVVASDSWSSPSIPSCGALLPGQVVQIRVGDVSQARKAWKKRRRSGSPLLVPATIAGVSREWMVRWNVMTMVHKYGEPDSRGGPKRRSRDGFDNIGGGPGGGAASNGVSLPVGKMCKLLERDLGGSLMDDAKALGYDRVGDMLLTLFDDHTRNEFGVEIVRGLDSLLLVSSLSRRQAREMAGKACLAHFAPASATDGGVDGEEQTEDAAGNKMCAKSANRMVHTGTAKVRNAKTSESDSFDGTPRFTIEPLSAAVRISQEDATAHRIVSGQECNAFVFNYDPNGDNGSPLVTLAVDPPRGLVRDQMKRRRLVRRVMEARRAKVEAHSKSLAAAGDTNDLVNRNLQDLKVGDGPFKAHVVAVSTRAGAAFLDCGVTRTRGRRWGGGTAKVLGMLRFDDVVQKLMEDEMHGDVANPHTEDDVLLLGKSDISEEEAGIIEAALMEGMNGGANWDEEEEDDGDGEVMTVEDLFAGDFEEEWEASSEDVDVDAEDDSDEDDDDDDDFAGMSPEGRLEAIGRMLEEEEAARSGNGSVAPSSSRASEGPLSPAAPAVPSEPMFMKTGDEIDVFVKAVFPQSGRFMLTLDPSVKGRKAKELKREKAAEKRMSKLAEKMGGGDGLGRILELIGTECRGVVRAKSKTGDWYYVQPLLADGDDSLPVGVANPSREDAASSEDIKSLAPGDPVRVRLEGIDETRGQLAMALLGTESLKP